MALVIEHVKKSYQTNKSFHNVLDDINIEIKDGEFVSLLGPSGCGKSSLLNIIAGLDKEYSGNIVINGTRIDGAGPDRAMVFQEAALFPWLSVIENLEFGMKIAGVPKKERKEKAVKYLKMVHLSNFRNYYVHELSGGMKQRVAIARALALNSDILLMDEPFAALDYQTRNILLVELQEIWMQTGKTIIFVTHNIEEAILLSDRVMVMSLNPGRIKKTVSIQLARPRFAENRDISIIHADLMKELKDEIEKAVRGEFDEGWHLEEDSFLAADNSGLGSGI